MTDTYLKDSANQILSLQRKRFSIKMHNKGCTGLFDNKLKISTAMSRHKLKEMAEGYIEIDFEEFLSIFLSS
jgi:hypothetical protein